METRVAIIGGGFSGIYALKYCIQEKLDCILFEGSDSIGGRWKYNAESPGSIYKNTCSSSSLAFLHPVDYPFPDDTPEFPHHSLIYEHLENYVEHFELTEHIKLSTYIEKIIKEDDKWKLFYIKNGQEIKEVFDKVIVCTGIHQVPFMPEEKIYENFIDPYKIIHSHNFNIRRDEIKDKKILIVGGGEAAHDIACDLAPNNNKLYMSIRNGRWFQEQKQGEVLIDLVFNRFLKNIWCNPIAHIISYMKEYLWGEGGSGIKVWKPNKSYFNSFITKGREHLSWISKGRIEPCGKIIDIEKNSIIFEDKKVDVDYIILCTGYQNTHLIKLLPNIKTETKNYKLIFNINDPSLSYCGFARPILTSLSSISELQAQLISKVYSNKIELPKKKLMLSDKDSYIINNHRINYLINPYIYSDELADLIGCKPNLITLFFKDHILWRQLFFHPWSQFHYTINSENEDIKKISRTYLTKLQKTVTAERLKRYTITLFTLLILIILLSIAIIIGLIFGFVKAKPYITKAFFVLLFLVIPI